MSATGNFQHDRRIFVLVLIGLSVCLPHLCKTLGSAFEGRDTVKNQPRIIWLETVAAQGNGLYWLDAAIGNWQEKITPLGSHLPVGASPQGGDALLPAYRLQADGQFQPLPSPAPTAPIFFQPIPINQASLETLMVIPGIGRRLAASIIDYRDRAGRIDDRASLLAIEGIGEKKATIIAGYVRFE